MPVTPGTAIVEVGDPADIEIEAEILSRDAVTIKPGAPVSMPLAWSQVKPGLQPLDYTVRTVPPLLGRLTAWQDYPKAARSLAAAVDRLGKP